MAMRCVSSSFGTAVFLTVAAWSTGCSGRAPLSPDVLGAADRQDGRIAGIDLRLAAFTMDIDSPVLLRVKVDETTCIREGSHEDMRLDELDALVGHFTKVTLSSTSTGWVASDVVISPEHVERGTLASCELDRGVLVLDTTQGSVAFSLTSHTWFQHGSLTSKTWFQHASRLRLTSGQACALVGHTAKVTTALADGRVISVTIGPEAGADTGPTGGNAPVSPAVVPRHVCRTH
jgi:hypothetical protein